MIIEAARFANLAHFGQRRKWCDECYIMHPMRVAGTVSLISEATEEMIAAAWLHDVIEDCGVSAKELDDEFGEAIADMVVQLTNPSKQFPERPRGERKLADRNHISECGRAVKLIKLCDRIDNLNGINNAPPDFRALYVSESRLLCAAINIPGYLTDELLRLCDIIAPMRYHPGL